MNSISALFLCVHALSSLYASINTISPLYICMKTVSSLYVESLHYTPVKALTLSLSSLHYTPIKALTLSLSATFINVSNPSAFQPACIHVYFERCMHAFSMYICIPGLGKLDVYVLFFCTCAYFKDALISSR